MYHASNSAPIIPFIIPIIIPVVPKRIDSVEKIDKTAF